MKKKIIIQPSHVSVYKFVKKFIDKKKFAPELNEIAKGVELTGRQVHRLIGELVELGYIGREPHKKRGLSIKKEI